MGGADLRGALLILADLSNANLNSAKLSHTNLGGALLIGADLFSADLNGAYLSGANLNGAAVSGVDLSDANLRGAVNLTQRQLDPACGTDVKLDPGLTIKPCQK